MSCAQHLIQGTEQFGLEINGQNFNMELPNHGPLFSREILGFNLPDPIGSMDQWEMVYILGCPPSQDACGKWRFRLGSPIKNVIRLVVTVTGRGDNPMYIYLREWSIFNDFPYIFHVECI